MIDLRFRRTVRCFVMLPEKIKLVGALRKCLYAWQSFEHEAYVLPELITWMFERAAVLSGTQKGEGEYPPPEDFAFPVVGGGGKGEP